MMSRAHEGIYYIGIDEAGYGPNLGPLVVGGSCWRSAAEHADLYEPLRPSVTTDPKSKSRIAIADSKSIHQPGRGAEPLLKHLLPLLLGPAAKTADAWPEMLRRVVEIEFPVADDVEPQSNFLSRAIGAIRVDRRSLADAFFMAGSVAGRANSTPEGTANLDRDWQGLRERFLVNCRDANIQLRDMKAICLMPTHYNDLVEAYGNKSSLLTIASLLLVRELWRPIPAGSKIRVRCDKHGGRNRYGLFLERVWAGGRCRMLEESASTSRYQVHVGGRKIDISFDAKGERNLPVALASMFAKALREAVMERWNSYWCGIIADLQPTQGYPVDAARFFAQIKPHLESQAIPKESVWRMR